VNGSVVAVFGGSFNPPHISHVLAATLVLATEAVDRLVVVPTYQHPFHKSLATFDDRVRMCELALGWLPRVEVSRVEEELGGESRTLRTLQHLAGKHPEWKLRFVMGADILVESHKWYGFDQIMALAPPIVLGRAGVVHRDAPAAVLPEVSSTDVRTRLAAGEYASLARLVPRAVLKYAQERGLYKQS
jgi:nicotinate-nucleotide adenylyltransferase